MHIKQPINQRQTSIKTYPIKKSSSAASLVIHGDKSDSNYPDSLMSFQKDFATMDKQRRQKQFQRKSQSLQRRKNTNLVRQTHLKQNQQASQIKLLERQKLSSFLYNKGQLKSTLSTSIPVNPISSEYFNNKKGINLAKRQEDKDMNRIVRGHFLHTIGNSGYNIITGKCSIDFEKYIPPQKHEAFEQKINQFYSRYKINPESP